MSVHGCSAVQNPHKLIPGDGFLLVQILRQLIELRAVVRENLHRFLMLLFHKFHYLTVNLRLGFRGTRK